MSCFYPKMQTFAENWVPTAILVVVVDVVLVAVSVVVVEVL